MNFSMPVRSSTFAIATILFSTFLLAIGRAERVGYQFTGQMTPPLALPGVPPPTTYTLFKVKVPVDAPIAGTFSYDTTSTETSGDDNSQVFTQSIQGGLTFDILGPDGAPLLHLVASQYKITVNNDFPPSNTPSPIDAFEVDLIPPPAPLLANGAAVTSDRSKLILPFNWDEQTFTGDNQPYLWSDLPPISYATIGFVGTSSLGGFTLKTLTPILPESGDYNFDGRVDSSDYAEWRKAFGYTDPSHLYADGNNNGFVDDADYVIWRNALSLSNANAVSVPEPSLISLAIVISPVIVGFRRRGI